MSELPPSSTPPSAYPPPPPPPAGAQPPGEPPLGEQPPRGPGKGLSTGAKIAIGCGALLLLVLIIMFACSVFVGKKVKDFGGAMEDQEEVTQKAEELEREHTFTAPANGELAENQVDDFFAVTDQAWGEMEESVEDMRERGERVDGEGGQAGFGDAMAGMQGLGRARSVMVDALDDHDMAPGAYVWTGFKLIEARSAAEGGGGAAVPQRNLDLAREHADELAELQDDQSGKGAVLGVAYMLFPRADVFVPAGMDTLFKDAP